MKANYHTHTPRCQHAVGTDEDYVRAALDGGFETLGFSDHTPWPFASGYVSGIRMGMELLPDYIASIRALKAKYASILPIYLGLEVEYFPRYKEHMLRMRDKGVQYFILGQHYLSSEEDHPYIGRACVEDDNVLRYGDAVAEGLRTGLFAYVAHPDLYCRSRPEFDKVCQRTADVISQAALEADVPLEYNLLGLRCELDGQGRGYPAPAFWEYLRGRGHRAILGVDAHNPESLRDTFLWEEGQRRLLALGYPVQEFINL